MGLSQSRADNPSPSDPSGKMASPFYSFSAQTIKGTPYALSELSGKVVLVVNVASRWRVGGVEGPGRVAPMHLAQPLAPEA